MTSAGVCTRGAAILVMLLCSQVAVAWADDNNNDDDNGSGGPKCSNNVCENAQGTYASKHFILVHGMGGGAFFWFEIVTMLERSGFKATAVDLTSHGINKAIADNVTTVAEYAKPLINAIKQAPGPVILVGHSLGGGVIAYASELCSTKVVKAIYLSAVTPSYNQNMFEAFPDDTFSNLLDPGYLILNFRKGSAVPSSAAFDINALGKFYMSGTPPKYIKLAQLLFTDTPFPPVTEELNLTRPKFGSVKRYFIRTGMDKTISPADQDAMIAANPPEKVFCIPGGDHAVFFSATLELFKLLTCIAGL